MSKKYEFHEIYSPPFRLTFPNLTEPDTFSDKPEFNFRALFAKDKPVDWFNNGVAECAKLNGFIDANNQYTIQKFPAQPADGDLAMTKDTPPIAYEGHPGHNWLKFRSSDNDGTPSPLGIIDRAENIIEAKDVYAGSWYQAIIRFCVFDNKFGVGIMTRCDHLQFLGHDEPFASSGGTKSTVKAFAKAPSVDGLLPPNVAQTATPAPQQQGNAPTPPQAAAPGNAPTPAPQAPAQSPPQTATPSMAPGEYQSEFVGGSTTNPTAAPPPPGNASAPPPPASTGPTMGPNADPNTTYDAYLAVGWTDEVMRANGIII